MWSHRVIREGWTRDAGNRKWIGLLRDGKGSSWQKVWLGFSTDSPKIWHPGVLDILRWRRLRNSGNRKGTLTSLNLPFFLKKVHETPTWKVPSLHREGTHSYLQSQGVCGLRSWCQWTPLDSPSSPCYPSTIRSPLPNSLTYLTVLHKFLVCLPAWVISWGSLFCAESSHIQ